MIRVLVGKGLNVQGYINKEYRPGVCGWLLTFLDALVWMAK